MCKEKQIIHYCTILSDEQWNFLLESKFSAFRQKCLYKLMTDAVLARTVYKIKGIEIVLEVGQVAASDVELAEYLGCNRKTIGKLIDSFNRLGMLTTRTNNRTSVHTLHFLTGWYVGGVLVTNPHYVRPSANTNGQTGNVRTPLFPDLPPGAGQSSMQNICHCQEQNADSTGSETATFSSSLCSPMASEHSGIWLNGKDRVTAGNHVESPKEAQDGTIDSEANIGKGN